MSATTWWLRTAPTDCRSRPASATAIRSDPTSYGCSTTPTTPTPCANRGSPATCSWWTTSGPPTAGNRTRGRARSWSGWPSRCGRLSRRRCGRSPDAEGQREHDGPGMALGILQHLEQQPGRLGADLVVRHADRRERRRHPIDERHVVETHDAHVLRAVQPVALEHVVAAERDQVVAREHGGVRDLAVDDRLHR